MNAQFDPKKLSKDQIESNSRVVSNLLFDAQVALEELTGVLIYLCTGMEETEEDFSNDKIKAMATICESAASEALLKVQEALPLCSIPLDKSYQKALGLLTAVEELTKMRVNRKYTVGFISGLFSFSEKLDSELEQINLAI